MSAMNLLEDFENNERRLASGHYSSPQYVRMQMEPNAIANVTGEGRKRAFTYMLICTVVGASLFAILFSLASSHLSAQTEIFTADSLQSSNKGSPHIIFILADDLGYNDVGWAGDDFEGITPTLDFLRNNGVELTSYYTQQICTPARAALLTGRYPYKTGMQSHVIIEEKTWGLPPEFSILPQYLANAGYKSYAVGKWNIGHYSIQQMPQERGFENSYGYLGSNGHYVTHLNEANTALDFYQTSTANNSIECIYDKNGIHNSGLFTDRALSIINNWKTHEEKNPIMLYLAYENPHTPLEVDPDTDYSPIKHILKKMDDPTRVKVAQLVYNLDLEVARLLDGLERAGMSNNTILVFTSDNGGCFFDGQSNYPLRGTKSFTFEGGSKVRSLIYTPLLPQSSVYSGLFHVTDWLPTLMDAAIPGWSYTDGEGGSLGLDGISHWEALKSGVKDAKPRREVVYNIQSASIKTSHKGKGKHQITVTRGAIRKDNWKLIVNDNCQLWGDFGGRYDDDFYTSQCDFPVNECASNGEHNGSWLFNLDEDPYETNDLYAQEPDIVKQLQQRFDYLALDMRPEESDSNDNAESKLAHLAWLKQGCISPWKAHD